MKKFICIVIVAILAMLFVLVACSGESPEPVQPDEIAIAEPAPVPAIEDPTIDQVLFDQNDINIICKGFVPGSADGWDDPIVKFLITNNTDKNITVQVRDVSVNGFMIDPFCSEEVAAGKKMNGGMSWLQMYFDENGIVEVENIEFYFHIFNTDDWETIAESEIITLNFN